MPAVLWVDGRSLDLVGSGRCFCSRHLFYSGATPVFSAGGTVKPCVSAVGRARLDGRRGIDAAGGGAAPVSFQSWPHFESQIWGVLARSAWVPLAQ